MRPGFDERAARPLIGALLGAWLTALLLAGAYGWADRHQALALRVALSQAEASRLAGMVNGVLARLDQAAIALALPQGNLPAWCEADATRIAAALPGAITGLTLFDAEGLVTCASLSATLDDGVVQAVHASFILVGSTVLDAVIVMQRQLQGRPVVSAGIRLEALRLAIGPMPAAALEDRRGTRVSLADGRVMQALPSDYFPPPAGGVMVALHNGQRVVARINDDLAVTLDLDGASPAHAQRAAAFHAGQVALALTGGLLLILLVLRLTVLRRLRRLGEPLDHSGNTDGLIDWMSTHPASPIRHLAARIIERELSQQQRVELLETLLREVNHRVAGHLQMVVSQLRLQARETAPAAVADALRRAEYRVNTMALVHQGMQQARRGEQLELLDLLRRVAVNLVEGSPMAEAISLHVGGASLVVSPEQGVPVALILNEWLTTALQRERPPAVVTVSLCSEGGAAVLDYRDGVDDRPRPDQLSPSMVRALCTQIGGHVQSLPGGGWRLSFPAGGRPDA